MRRLLLSLPPRTLLAGLAVLLWMLLGVVAAHAHGDLLDGGPGPGDTVAVGTATVTLQFEALHEEQRSYIAVLNGDEEPVSVGEVAVVGGAFACARTVPLDAGVHTVEYSVMHADGHRLTSRYMFKVSDSGDQVEAGPCGAVDLAAPGEARRLTDMTTQGPPMWLVTGLGVIAVVGAFAAIFRLTSERRGPRTEDAAD